MQKKASNYLPVAGKHMRKLNRGIRGFLIIIMVYLNKIGKDSSLNNIKIKKGWFKMKKLIVGGTSLTHRLVKNDALAQL